VSCPHGGSRAEAGRGAEAGVEEPLDAVFDGAGLGADSDLLDLYVLAAVVGQIDAQHVGGDGGFEGDDVAAVGQLREQHGIYSDISADVEYLPIWLHILDEPMLRLRS
jgi:hypothetical protein